MLAGASMGAHTVLRLALDHGDRVAGLVLITPAYTPEGEHADLERWDALSEGLRTGGVEGFVAAYGDPGVPEAWRDTVIRVLHQRLAAHEHPDAVADALRAVPRSRPFAAWDELAELDLPCVVVASRDEADPGHPFAVGERYAEVIPGAELRTEEPGASPLAWQGGQLSKVIAELSARAPLDRGLARRQRLHPRHQRQRALDDRVAVVGDRELPVLVRRRRITRQAAKSGESATNVAVPRSGSSGASVPPRTPGAPSSASPALSTPTNATRSARWP